VLSLGLAAAPRVWGRCLLQAWRWALLGLALYVLCQRLGWDPMTAYVQAGSRTRAMGSFGNATYCAAFLCLSWPLLLAWKGRLKVAALVLAFAALLATQSRAALLAALAQAGLLLFFRVRARGRGERVRSVKSVGAVGSDWFMGLGLGLAVLLTALLFPASQWLRPTLRWPLWKASLDLWFERPWLGWGPGAFAVAFQDHAPAGLRALVNAGNAYAEAPHQLLLGLACSAGGLGLAVFAGASAFFARLVWTSPLAEARALGLGALGLLVESQADRFFFLPGLFVPLAALLGLLAWREKAALPARAGHGRKARRASGGLRTLLAWVCMALTFVFAWTGILTLLDGHRGLGTSLDAGVGVLASAGDAESLAQQVRSKPDNALTQERLGDALAAQHQYEPAAQALARSLVLKPNFASAQNLGNCYMMLGRPARAEAAFRVALRLAPDNADVHFSLGYALYYEKRLKPALVELDTALRLDPGNAGAAQLKRQILR
ncbi:MAG: tetratricopeptide repeat protein, partial [bacterium]